MEYLEFAGKSWPDEFPAPLHESIAAMPPTTASRPQPLDPRTLGRPVHLLPRFARLLELELAELFRPYNRRHRAQYQLGAISIKPLLAPPDTEASALRWLSGAGPAGPLACLLPRPLLLSLMAHRYGAPEVAEGGSPAGLPAETATEERLQRLLAQQLLGVLLQQAGMSPAEPALLQHGPRPALAPGAWLVRVPVRELGQALDSEMLIALDAAYIDPLLKRLAVQGLSRGAVAAAEPVTPLPRRLQIKVAARLLEQTLPLGELLDLKPGDLVPVRLGSTQVLVDGSPLFSASVAEHQGKLCLTSFADLE